MVITHEDLEGRTVTSPYFALSYLAARGAGATDWFHGVSLATGGKGRFSLEYHHIHPRRTLTGSYSRHQINDLANFAFISKRANLRISARSPKAYFEDLEATELATHFVPDDLELRTADRYLEFLDSRRALLAEAMTAWIQRFRPSYVRAEDAPARPAGTRVELQMYHVDVEATGEEHSDFMSVSVHRPGGHGWTLLPLDPLRQAIADVDDGLIPTMTIDKRVVDVSSPEDPDQLRVPAGPIRLIGTSAEWRQVLDREEVEIRPLAQLPEDFKDVTWAPDSDDQTDYFILDTD